ncbi:hypothetical protein GWI33_007695 [Rhynchophorus ferrugineus]|uniref:Uncharacterized protein n=1 Tax=Rhynchophorus ferrugineus TaxID=354439 RepID=A0A834ID59_RHYFE|nr:hypothetical protein GWI33_007695 [Rhynchophorus ferrugineus]
MSLAERDPNKDILAEKSAGKYMVSAGRRRDGSGFLSYCYGCCVTDVAKYDDFDPDFHKFTDGYFSAVLFFRECCSDRRFFPLHGLE